MDPEVCIACGAKFVEAHEGRRSFCEDCDKGPFCRSCLTLRHKLTHEHSLWTRIRRALGWHRCIACVEVARR